MVKPGNPAEIDLVTPSEAYESWCPFARARIGQGGEATVANRSTNISDVAEETFDFTTQYGASTTCIGPHCMAWRTARATEDDDRYGYCGLAGKPEAACS